MSRSPEQSLKLPPHPRAERKRYLPIIAVFTKKCLLQASSKALPVTQDPPVTKPSADAELSLRVGFLTAAPHRPLCPTQPPAEGSPGAQRSPAEPLGQPEAPGLAVTEGAPAPTPQGPPPGEAAERRLRGDPAGGGARPGPAPPRPVAVMSAAGRAGR